MNTSKNRNRWAVSAKALAEGAPTIKGKPIGCGKGYKIDDHYPDGKNMDVGKFTSYEIPSSYMTAKAKIDDDVVWGHLEAKEWGPISIVIWPYEANCSSCGADVLKDLDDRGVFNHDHILDGTAYAQLESFKFERVDFVDDPAYPQAGILDMQASAEDITQAILLVASYSTGGAQGSSNPLGVNKKLPDKTPEELQVELNEKLNEIADLKKTVTTLETAAAKADDSKDDNKDDDKDKDPELEKMKERLEALEAQRSQTLIDKAAEARFKAGLVEDLEEERTRLADFPQAYLLALIADAGILEEKIKATQKRRAPKTGYDQEEELTGFDAAFKAVKDRLIPPHISKMLLAQVAEVSA